VLLYKISFIYTYFSYKNILKQEVEKSRKKYLFLFDKGVYKFHEKRYNNTDKKQRWTKR